MVLFPFGTAHLTKATYFYDYNDLLVEYVYDEIKHNIFHDIATKIMPKIVVPTLWAMWPRPASSIIMDKTGDCSERATIAIALLRKHGIPALGGIMWVKKKGKWIPHAVVVMYYNGKLRIWDPEAADINYFPYLYVFVTMDIDEGLWNMRYGQTFDLDDFYYVWYAPDGVLDYRTCDWCRRHLITEYEHMEDKRKTTTILDFPVVYPVHARCRCKWKPIANY